MFNGSSNIYIQGGTFVSAGNIDRASLEEMGVNFPPNSAIESNYKRCSDLNFCASHASGRGPTNQFSHSAGNFGRSIYASGQVPECSPYLMPTPSITSEVKSWDTIGASRRDAKLNVDSHAPPFHSQCLAICQSHNMACMHSRSSFKVVVQLVLSLIILSLTHRHRLLATMSKRPHTHSQHLLPLFQSQN